MSFAVAFSHRPPPARAAAAASAIDDLELSSSSANMPTAPIGASESSASSSLGDVHVRVPVVDAVAILQVGCSFCWGFFFSAWPVVSRVHL
jgi:hypothetical protein